MFTVEEREAIKAELIEAAQVHSKVSGVAVTGSASIGKEDRWSDIDLAFGIRDEADLTPVLNEFTELMSSKQQVVDHMDVHSGKWIYRVFLLANTLQVDVAFAPASVFGARGPTFKLISGEAIEPLPTTKQDAKHHIRWGWLYALHVRSCIARSKPWQAEYMISGMRDQAIALACLRFDLPTDQGRGVDLLPKEFTAPLEDGLVRSLDGLEQLRAFKAVIRWFLTEAEQADPELSARIAKTLHNLTDIPV